MLGIWCAYGKKFIVVGEIVAVGVPAVVSVLMSMGALAVIDVLLSVSVLEPVVALGVLVTVYW